jgi:hypothetical protein
MIKKFLQNPQNYHLTYPLLYPTVVLHERRDMDPNETLSSLRATFARWEEWGTLEVDAEEAMDSLTDLFFALDNWLTSGGFRPDDWS